MLRTASVMVTALGLSLLSVDAMADHRLHRHDKELAYVLGGALVGAAIGELVYSERYGQSHSYHYHRPRYRYYRPSYGRHYRAVSHHHYRPARHHRHRHGHRHRH